MTSNGTAVNGMVAPVQVPFLRTSEQNLQPQAGLTGRIIVAEDNYLVGMTVEGALIDAGYEVLAVVNTGEEALSEGTRLRPDLVIMDIRLAGEMTGIDAAVALRAEGVTSLFASAHSDAAIRSAGEEARPAGWLTKPFSNSQLISAVAAALSQTKSH